MRALIVRPSSLGDIVQALPAANDLKASGYEVGWIVEEDYYPLLKMFTKVDRVFPLKLRKWRAKPNLYQIRKAWMKIRRFSPEIAFELTGMHKGAMLAWLSGAPTRVGWSKEAGSSVWLTETVNPLRNNEHIIHFYKRIIEQFTKKKVSKIVFDLLVDTNRNEVDVAIFPFSRWKNKNYPLDRWIAIADYLNSLKVKTFIVINTKADSNRFITVNGIPELLYFISKTKVVVGPDTGPLHLAVAMGKKTVFVMGPTRSSNFGPIYNGAVVTAKLPCLGCGKLGNQVPLCMTTINNKTIIESIISCLNI